MARFLTYARSPWAIILLVSVALFTFWGGPVFTAPSLSQGGRLLVSYLFIPLAVAAVLLWKRQWEWGSFGYHTVSLALVKMVITMTVHLWVVPRGERVSARDVPAQTGVRDHYQAQTVEKSGGIVGQVRRQDGTPSGFVALLNIKAGKPAGAMVHTLTLGSRGYSPSWILATVRDEILLASGDSLPHTFVLSDSAGEALQIPLPPGHPGTARALLRPGFFQSRCSFDHPGEHVKIWVFEHPYHAFLDSAGAFRLDQVPGGTFYLGAWTTEGSAAPWASQEIRVQSGRIDTVVIGLIKTPDAGEE